jgi:heme exporter protein A
VVALLGANGAGKSTLLRIISGLLKADRGEIVLGGVPMAKAGAELRRYVGLVSHAPLLYDHLSGLENLTFFANLYDLQESKARVEAILQAVDLWRRRNDLVRTYSRGMQQRLAIARAILHDPPVLLLDEPDTGLDQQSAHMLQTLLQQLSDKRRAILFSTHNLDRALGWANSVALLLRGTISYHGPVAGLDEQTMKQLQMVDHNQAVKA